jgi:hypothetical protein
MSFISVGGVLYELVGYTTDGKPMVNVNGTICRLDVVSRQVTTVHAPVYGGGYVPIAQSVHSFPPSSYQQAYPVSMHVPPMIGALGLSARIDRCDRCGAHGHLTRYCPNR